MILFCHSEKTNDIIKYIIVKLCIIHSLAGNFGQNNNIIVSGVYYEHYETSTYSKHGIAIMLNLYVTLSIKRMMITSHKMILPICIN